MASARRPFPGGGETGALMRAHDWAASPLGPSEGWPAALHAALNLMLNSPESMYLVWGPELTFFYNDAYRPVLGPRLDGALGRPLPVLWADAWEAVRGPLERALAGTAGRFENAQIAMARRGVGEETWWSYSYSPLYDDDGRIAGVFCVTNETTASVLAERARHRSEVRQRQSLQQMPGFVAVLSGPDHVFDYVNDAYVTIAGPRDFIGRSVRAVFPELEGQGFYELLDAVYATGEPFSARAMPIRLTGEESDRAIDLLYQPLRDDQGAVTGIFVGGYDATEQARSTAALRDLNADLERQVTERSRERSLTWQVSPDLLSIIGPDGVFEATNPAWEATLGWTTEELRTHYGTIVHPEDLEASAAVFRDVIGGHPVLRFENRYRRKAGGYRWLSWVAVPESGRVYCSARDVTEQKAYARTLHLYESIIQSNASPICAFDTEFRLIAFNAAHSDDFYRIYGYRVQVGDVFPDLFLPEQGAVMRGFMARALTGEIFSVVEEFGDPALVKPYWEVSYTPLRDAGGRIIGAFHYASDITERLRAQADLQMAQEALRQSQKMEAVGQLTGGLAHDFNNLLAGISGSLELMQSRMSQGRVAEVQRYIAAAQGAARRAAALTHRLLAFSRRQTLDPRPISVNRLIGGMQEMIQRTVGPAITLEVSAAPDLWPALVDPSQLENALLNLCINARDAMPDGGRITVETANVVLDEGAARARDLAPGPYLSLAVTDTGTGMVPEVIARVFEPFFTTKPLGEGTGLGLSMIYGFAQQSGGQVRLSSEVGRGTAVRLYLPRHEGGVEGGVEDEEDGSDAASLPRAERGETVLVVDDEPTVRMLVADILDELGYTAIEAADSAAGLRVLQSDVRIDLLVTDVGLPGGMNGRQMADAGRERRPGLKVLFITGYAETAVLGNRHLSPGMAVLTKPFPMETMAARIRAMIEA